MIKQDLKEVLKAVIKLQADKKPGNSSNMELDDDSLWYRRYKKGNGAEVE